MKNRLVEITVTQKAAEGASVAREPPSRWIAANLHRARFGIRPLVGALWRFWERKSKLGCIGMRANEVGTDKA
jgi:hypothetical protein